MGKRFSPGRGRRGFTLSEVLIAVAVLVVLAGLAVPNIIHYQRLLNMQALDGYAREIFLVAQNHMTARKSDGTLTQLGVKAEADTAYLSQDTITALMPSSALEGELMGNFFYVTYHKPTGSVLSVTYGESEFRYEEGLAAEGKTVQERMKAGTWIGYYTGQPAGNLSDEVQLPTPTLTIVNGEKLLAQVTAKLPTGMSWNRVKLNVAIAGVAEDVAVDGVTVNPPTTHVKEGISTRTYTLVLDSLIPGEQFKDLASGITPGGDFKLSVSIHSLDSTVGNSGVVWERANSLFAAVDGGTAHISYGRHLQNLSTAVSGVNNITAAEQISDIRFDDTNSETDWYSYYTAKGVAYAPIANDSLTSYDGNKHTITGLTVRATAGGAVGMFDHVTGSLEGIYLVNPKMIGTAQSGALAGYSSGNLTISDCRVYHAYTGSTPKEVLAGKGYQISGSVAGGLVGSLSGVTKIENSFAATILWGTKMTGGLVGESERGSLTISSSYADCYLSSGESAGGLVGEVEDACTISNCYTAGFVAQADEAAGMVVGEAHITDSYSALVYLDASTEIHPLAEEESRSAKAYYLPVPGVSETSEVGTQISSSELMKLRMDGFGAATFASTHPYNLMAQMALTVYPFPKLTTLPHYGDWKAEFESGALVYYEEYADNSYGFSGGALNFLKDSPPLKDGYAIAYAKAPQNAPSVTYKGTVYSIPNATYIQLPVTAANDTQTTYYLLLLPDAVLAHAPTEGSTGFYERISTTIDGATPYWFNPHFAAYCAVGIYADGNAAMGAFVAEGTVGANTYYLNDGNYFLNTDPSGHKYSLTFPATNGGAKGRVAAELVALSIPGMAPSTETNDTTGNPYPTVLDDGHHGPWLRALDLGDIGVAYWEKESRDGNDEYLFSYLGATKDGAPDPGLKGALLCTLHDDGGVITDYGYAYYYRNATVSSAKVGANGEIVITGPWDGEAAKNTEAAGELMKQMGGVYTFVAYNTYDQTAGEGLRPRGNTRSGAWPIVADGKTYYYRISPFFAESMEYMGTNSATGAEALGKTGKPYGVRSLRQLQFINWNSEMRNYTTDADLSATGNPYPYLRRNNNMGFQEFCWLQSHDLQAAVDGKVNTDYQPIGSLKRPFSGYFDGDNYAIRNLSFTSPSRFVGLFSVADGAVLTNIVMHTTQGTSVIRGTFNGDIIKGNSGVGGLVGFARNKAGKIENCSISDYEIVNDVTVLQTAGDTDRTGAATGGLAGWSEVNITNCTAITYVHGGGKITATNGGFKVSGLVGANGPIDSIYLRDPDENLIEISVYRA